ncbi:MAG: iron ABC transporter substrate-binding protein, partial [Firmicutes bacterium]|nr:iron ABC transporter substrate-binding protein [Bacillota bacterium]
FADIDPAAKADEIYEFLVGQGVYARMAADYGGFQALTLE